ncbi:MAG: type II toxin-antitoxin system PemK/MazF family toxin [Clostridia bacterium]
MTEKTNNDILYRKGDIIELKKDFIPQEFQDLNSTFGIIISNNKTNINKVTILPIIQGKFRKTNTVSKIKLSIEEWKENSTYMKKQLQNYFICCESVRTVILDRVERIIGRANYYGIESRLTNLFKMNTCQCNILHSWVQKCDIAWYDWGQDSIGHETSKHRPTIVLAYNANKKKAIISPITTSNIKSKRGYSEYLSIFTDDINRNFGRNELSETRQIILLDEFRTVSVLFDSSARDLIKVGELFPDMYEKVNKSLRYIFDIGGKLS